MPLPSLGGTGDFLPIIKWDSRAGKMFRVDRERNEEGEWSSATTELPTPEFMADFANVELGWFAFIANRPDLHLMPYVEYCETGVLLPQPSGEHRMGFRLLVKMHPDQGGDLRHFSHSARCVYTAFNKFFTELEKSEEFGNGQVPVVRIAGSEQIKTSNGTNYAPKFAVVEWVERPTDFDGSHYHEKPLAQKLPAVEEIDFPPSPAPTAAVATPPTTKSAWG